MCVCETFLYTQSSLSVRVLLQQKHFHGRNYFLVFNWRRLHQWIWRVWCKSRVVTLLALELHENDEELKMHCANRAQHNRSKFLKGSKLLMGLFFPDSSLWVTHPKRRLRFWVTSVTESESYSLRKSICDTSATYSQNDWVICSFRESCKSYFRELSHLFIHSSTAQQEGRGRGRWVESQYRNWLLVCPKMRGNSSDSIVFYEISYSK